ncbi:MAG: ROK family protein [Coprobacillus sp.]|nr:ROK family protein [Coprobacillus sp.]
MKNVISLDIGGTNFRIALVSPDYELVKVERKENKCYGNVEMFYSEVISLIDSLGADFNDIECISIGVPGRVRKNGMIDALPNIGINNVNLKGVLENKYPVPVYIANDAEMGLLAEAVKGNGKCYDGVYFITISTGVGGAFAYKGKVKNYGKEIGHIPMTLNGVNYDFESICSGRGLVHMSHMFGLSIERASEFFTLVRGGNKLALEIYNIWLTLFSEFLQYTKKIYNPDIYTFTGGVFKNKDLILPKLKEMNPTLNMVECYYSEDAGLVGSAAYGFSQREEERQ